MTLPGRIEAAEGGSRELDAEIAVLAGWRLVQFNCTNINGSTERGEIWFPSHFGADDKAEVIASYREAVAVNMWPDESDPPPFSTSIDAAMQLVPEGFCVTIGRDYNGSGWAHVESPCELWPSNASTPALALCAAALRARGKG